MKIMSSFEFLNSTCNLESALSDSTKLIENKKIINEQTADYFHFVQFGMVKLI